MTQSTPGPSSSKLEPKMTDFPIIKWSLKQQLLKSGPQAELKKKQEQYLLRVDLDSDISSMQIVGQKDEIVVKISSLDENSTIVVRDQIITAYTNVDSRHCFSFLILVRITSPLCLLLRGFGIVKMVVKVLNFYISIFFPYLESR